MVAAVRKGRLFGEKQKLNKSGEERPQNVGNERCLRRNGSNFNPFADANVS
jgi:hypothetical protein